MDEGPKVKIRTIDFVGNKAISDGTLQRQDEGRTRQRLVSCRSAPAAAPTRRRSSTRTPSGWSSTTATSGYIKAQVGDAGAEGRRRSDGQEDPLGRAADSGHRRATATRSASFDFDGNTVVKADALRPLFKLKTGEYYSEKEVRKGLEKAREVYGAGGYMEFTGYPDPSSRDRAEPGGAARRLPRSPRQLPTGPADRRRHDADAGRQAVLRQPHHVHRQHDDARQRDPARDAAVRGRRLQHRGAEVQHQAAESARLLQAARRTGKDVDVDKTPGQDNKVDVTLKLEEQNRNQLTFGAGVSQFEGFFGQLSFQTVELPRPRREPDVSLSRRARARRTTRWRSPSRSSSTATSPAASTSSRARSGTSASSRSSRPAAS